ncbi:Daunorubicin/doxorubicin resistance ATP-binding protein DrrA [BD1-7 clade bacterium]|uniref:Daunorubicin/doxorubicin resistance ATP-binding protein DrrA n=1 Tax=BD1-7 clade bacterium TaxID=2029982 RepID=A0A5S9P8Z7_9GAMM|nr:Daunorubicin/doxorubicin resistance ATP-binding protein DrrA [BD1-7 clade bacterium]
MKKILEVRNLTKHYKQLAAVNGISFTVEQGICFGLLGPNGAGKTTTIEIIEGIKSATGGEILFDGKLRDKGFAEKIGIQFQETALMDYLSVEETLVLFASFYRSPQPIEHLIELCDLTQFRSQIATKLSGGQRQRLLLALALINDPELIFLDEPTTGLDPQSRRRFWELIKNIKNRGKTIILTTHYMDEAEMLCDHMILVDQGKIIAEGSPKALLDEHFPYQSVSIDSDALPTPHPANFAPDDIREQRAWFNSSDVDATVARLVAEKVELSSLKISAPNLEDLFIKLTGHDLRQ